MSLTNGIGSYIKVTVMAVCMHPGCGQIINPKRAKLGYVTCPEHGEGRRTFTVVPVPKSNGVVGSVEELKGIAGSHKGSTLHSQVGHADDNPWQFYPKKSYTPEPPKPQPSSQFNWTPDLSDAACKGLIQATPSIGQDYYWSGDEGPGLNEAYRKGLTTAKSKPCRLTKSGLLIRVMLQQGKKPNLKELNK